MKNIELHTSFLIGINKLDSLDKPTTYEIEKWLNLGKEKFFTTRYTGLNSKQEGFERSQKRVDDLRTCVKSLELNVINDLTPYEFNLPDDYIYFVGETLTIVPAKNFSGKDSLEKCWPKDNEGNFIPQGVATVDTTQDMVNMDLVNSLAPHHYVYGQARPLRLMKGASIYLYTDGKYEPYKYIITYLRFPDPIDIHSEFAFMDEYVGLPEHTHREVVQMAITLYLAAVGGETIQLQEAKEQTME
jgi:hypothetical protein